MEENQNEPMNENTQNAQNASQVDDRTVNFNFTSEDLKNETKQTVNEVRETIKNTNFKNDSQVAKGFFSSFFKDPLGEIRKCSSGLVNNLLKISIIVLVVWLVVILFHNIISIASRYLFGTYGSFSYFFKNLFPNLLGIVKDLVAPVIAIVVLSGLTYGFNQNKDKSFIKIASTIVIAYIPTVIATIVNLLVLFGSGITKITSYFSSFCSTLSTILLYVAIKELCGESDNKSYFWKFALIMGIFCVVDFVLSYLGIYL